MKERQENREEKTGEGKRRAEKVKLKEERKGVEERRRARYMMEKGREGFGRNGGHYYLFSLILREKVKVAPKK